MDIMNFNPRSPHRERRILAIRLSLLSIFQSTLPSQGATQIADLDAIFTSISIHAPLTGSDFYTEITIMVRALFQSTLPSQGATHTLRPSVPALHLFQSTLPSQGATYNMYKRDYHPDISIHAPLTGSDPYMPFLRRAMPYFNPRSPHRERLCSMICSTKALAFQSTLPSQGATLSAFPAPLTFLHFNPRSPHRERLCGGELG